MNKMIESKTVIITGAASGIGQSTVERFSRDPKYNPVFAVDKDPSVHHIFPQEHYPQVVPLQVDLRSARQIDELARKVVCGLGRVDVVANAAGEIIAGRKRPIYEYYRTEVGRQQMLSLWRTNEHAVYSIMQAVEATMRNQGGGTIINVTSSKNYFPDPYRREYEESKQRVEELSLDEAKRLRRDNIRVVVVKPGNTKTNIDRGIWVSGSSEGNARVVQGFNDRWRRTFGNDPADVAEVIYQIAEGRIKKNRVHVGFDAKLGHFLVRTVPFWRQMFYLGAYCVYGVAKIVQGFRSTRVDLGVRQILDNDWYDELEAERKLRTAPVVKVGNKGFYRLCQGVSASVVQLQELGVSFDDLNGYVSTKVAEHRGQTRLVQSCEPETDGDWRYHYAVTQDSDSPLIYGKETVDFRSEEVFAHYLVFSPVN